MKKLTPVEAKIVKGKLEGKKSHVIAKEVNLHEVTVRKKLQSATIQDAVRAEMARQGITLEKVIKPVTEALEASEAIYSKDGEYIGENIKHSVRLQAADRAARWLGIDKAVSLGGDTPLSPDEVKQLASESDEVQLTQVLFRKQG